MLLDLRSVFETEGSKKEFSEELDEREYELFGTKPFVERISVRGEVTNRAGVVTLSVQVSFPLRVACDRCLEEFTRQYDYTFTHTLVQQLQDEWQDYILVEDGMLDLEELILSDILLELPTKLLCKEDCKGLCPHCGCNLNHQSCDCNKAYHDPRWDVLNTL